MELSEYGQSKSKFSRTINIRGVRFEKVLPLFTGLLGSLIVCSVVAARVPAFGNIMDRNLVSPITELRLEDAGSFFLLAAEQIRDPVIDYYRNPDYKDWVIDFFTVICSSKEIATAILQNADEYNVPAALVFSLSWEESRFNPRAVNRHNRDGSIDRGLFQLNNRSFPQLDINSVFDIEINARHGIGHLRHCLDVTGTEVSALAMYNAGLGRINSSGAPRVTLNYISRILDNRIKIENRFNAMLALEEEARLAEETLNAVQQQQQMLHFNRTLIPASPL